MNSPDYFGLGKNYLDRFKKTGKHNEYTARCVSGEHEDNNNSLCYNVGTGLGNCYACGYKFNAYQLAVKVGHPKPTDFIASDSSNNGIPYYNATTTESIPTPTKKEQPAPDELRTMMDLYKTNLRNNMDKYPHNADPKLIDLLDIGYDTYRKKLVWGHHDYNGNLISIQTHKGAIIGDTRPKWYAQHITKNYDHDKDIIICEGQPDWLVAYSKGHQVFTGTNGCKSIPKNADGNDDLEIFQYFNKDTYIFYDHDDAGYGGGEKLGKKIKTQYPAMRVLQAQYDSGLPKGYDISDAFIDDPAGVEFMLAGANAVEIKLPQLKLPSFEIITDMDADKEPLVEPVQIVEHLLIENSFHVFGGTAGSNKSIFKMTEGMSIANDEDNFLGFKISKKGLKVAYIDTECGGAEMRRRYKKLQKNFPNWKSTGRFVMISRRNKMVSEVLSDVEMFLRAERPDIVYYDCLYNMKRGTDISKDTQLSPITDAIFDFKFQYHHTPTLVAHATKGNHEQGLVMDRIKGGSHLQNCAEHIALLTKTNRENLRMFRVDKSRSTGFPTCYYGTEWDGDTFKLGKREFIENYREYLLSEQKQLMWSEYLEDLPDTFETKDWLNVVTPPAGTKSERTAKSYLREMVMAGLLTTPHKGSGIYTKNMTIIKADNNEE